MVSARPRVQGLDFWAGDALVAIRLMYTTPSSPQYLPGAHIIIAGSGKTVLASMIIETVGRDYAAADNHAPMLYFFFDFNDVNKQKAEDLVRSLIWQLAAKSESTVTFLQALYSEQQAQPIKMMASLQTWIEVLLKLLRKQSHCYIIIDALDECAELQELMEALALLLSSTEPSVRWLFVSQPAVELRSMLLCHPVSMVEIRSSVVDQDIRSYVSTRLEIDSRLKSFPPSVKTKIKQVIEEKCSGM